MTNLELEILNLKINLNKAIQNNDLDLAKSSIETLNKMGDLKSINISPDPSTLILDIAKIYANEYNNEAYEYIIKNVNSISDSDRSKIVRFIDIRKLFYVDYNNITNDIIEETKSYVMKHAKEDYIFMDSLDDYAYASMLIELAIRCKLFDIVDIIQNMITERM